jgi:hypothetical protein
VGIGERARISTLHFHVSQDLNPKCSQSGFSTGEAIVGSVTPGFDYTAIRIGVDRSPAASHRPSASKCHEGVMRFLTDLRAGECAAAIIPAGGL